MIKIGVGRTLNDCFITKNGNVATNMKLPKIENVASIMERRKYIRIEKVVTNDPKRGGLSNVGPCPTSTCSVLLHL